MDCPRSGCTLTRSITRRTRGASRIPAAHASGHAAEHLRIVLDRGLDHLRGVLEAVAAGDADPGRLSGNELIGGEVVLEALEQCRRQLDELLCLAPDVIALEYRNDLVVGFAAVENFQSADHTRAQQHFGVIDGTLADHADIERIAVTALAARREPPHPLAAVGLR